MSHRLHHIDELLTDLALDTLPAAQRAGADAHLAGCEPCRAALAQLRFAVGQLGHLAPAVSPPPQLAERLVAAVGGADRFARHAPQVAQLFDVDEPSARALLRSLAQSDESAWQPGPVPEVQLVRVPAGPARAGSLAGFARLRAGTRFPDHRHRGHESVLVLQGGMREDSGEEFWPGELNAQPDGSAHGFDVLPHLDCLCAVLLEGEPVFA